MGTRSHNQSKSTPEPTTAAPQTTLQPRPFAQPTQTESTPTLEDVHAQLEHAQQSGHHLTNFAASQPEPPPLSIQPKLTIGAPGDKYEQEADRVAQQVVQRIHMPKPAAPLPNQPASAVQREPNPIPHDLQLKPLLQREEVAEEDELQMKPILQRKTDTGAVDASTELEHAIQQSRGSGQSLTSSLRQPLEHAFGNVDFSGVKVHTDGQADQLNRSIQAKAFTTGQDIFFRRGAYEPGSRRGQELIAHELTHVVQQNGSTVQQSNSVVQQKKTNTVCRCPACSSSTEEMNIQTKEVANIQKSETNHHNGCNCSACFSIRRQSDMPTVMRHREKLASNSPALLVNVSPDLLDKGSKLLQQINRPPKVNDAGADKLSNCALTTLAAIKGSRTSGGIASDVRTTQGVGGFSSTEQSQKLWAITLADADTVKTLGNANLLTKKHHEANKEMIKNLEEFSEGNAYVVGDAQYYGMLNFLLNLAKEQGTDEVEFKVYEVGEPGNQMFEEATLVSKMGSYPNGTRFAVFVYSSDPTQHVRAHWVYAEKSNNNVIFQDYQVNTGQNNPVDSYLNQFPFSPDVRKDQNKTFEKGSFIAYVPFFSGDIVPVISGKEVNPQTVSSVIGEVQAKMQKLRQQVETPGERMSSDWSHRIGSNVSAIPAPSVIEAGIRNLTSHLGVQATCQFGSLTKAGVIRIMGSPTHSSVVKKIRKRLPGKFEAELVDFQTDQVSFELLNNVMHVVKPNEPPTIDSSEIPQFNQEVEPQVEYREAFAKSYQIQAQVTTEAIELNANWMEFTDIIHEATHSFEAQALNNHLKEGLADVFASMVAQNVQSSTGDSRFEYKYNPSYTPFVVAVQELINLMGLPTLAKLYFESRDHKGFLETAITDRVSAPNNIQIKAVVAKILNGDEFPGGYYQALQDLRGMLSGTSPVLTQEQAKYQTDVYDPRKEKFSQSLSTESSRLGKHFGVDIPTSSQRETAGEIDKWYGVEIVEKRIKILYAQKADATGQQFINLMKLIDGHEAAVVDATGETREALRKRLVPMHKDFIVDNFWDTLEAMPGNSRSIDTLLPFFEPTTGLLKSQANNILSSPKWKNIIRSSKAFSEKVRYEKHLPHPEATEKIEIKLGFLRQRGRV